MKLQLEAETPEQLWHCIRLIDANFKKTVIKKILYVGDKISSIHLEGKESIKGIENKSR